ncbi:hypothetical protein J3F81_001276 [Coemansia sp. RSA 371]|nr:hypothetical protein J3F81_001276 [Coemansia sp. RSA 371]
MEDMDPFEARLLFGNMLDNLTGAQPTIDRVSSFALKNSSLADDLFECINEKLTKMPVPPRLNILLMLDGILKQNTPWTSLIERNVVRLVAHTTPKDDPRGDANVVQTRKLVDGWRRKHTFSQRILDEMDERLVGRKSMGEGGMRHQDILKRIEEDRERHKRHKEDVWIRKANEEPQDELDLYWDTQSQATLRKPFKSPARVTTAVSTPSRPHRPVPKTAPPALRLTQTSTPPSKRMRTTPRSIQHTPIKLTTDPDLHDLVLQKSKLTKQLTEAREQTTLLERAIALQSTNNAQVVDALVDKWQTACAAACEDLFVLLKPVMQSQRDMDQGLENERASSSDEDDESNESDDIDIPFMLKQFNIDPSLF